MLDTVAMVFSWVLLERGFNRVQDLVNCLVSHGVDAYLMTGPVKDPEHLM